jgi:hypothetical protein
MPPGPRSIRTLPSNSDRLDSLEGLPRHRSRATFLPSGFADSRLLQDGPPSKSAQHSQTREAERMDGILNPTVDELTRPARHHAPMSDVFRLSWRCGSDHVESAVSLLTESS